MYKNTENAASEKESDTLSIQKPITRSKSLHIQLSNESWENGHVNFFLNAVPFSFGSGKYYATALADYFIDTVENSPPQEHYFVYEIGAGLGSLSQYFLNHLAAQKPDLYQRTTAVVTEYNDKQVKQLQDHNLFYDHKDHVTIQKLDFCNLPQNLDPPPFLVFFTNLIDSIPCHHFEVKSDGIYELQVETKLSTSFEHFDTTVFPPRVLNANELKDCCFEDNSVSKRTLMRHISNHLDESFLPIPLAKTALTDTQKKQIIQFVDTTLSIEKYSQKRLLFNAHFDAYTAIKQLLSCPSLQGGIIGLDFGVTSPNDLNDTAALSAHYNSTLFTTVYCPLLENEVSEIAHYASCQHLSGNTTKKSSKIGGPISILIAPRSSANPNQKIDSFSKTIGQTNSQKTEIAQEQITHLAKEKNTDISNILATLTPNEQSNFSLQLTIANHYLQSQEFDKSLSVIETAIQEFGPTAIPFYALSGIIYESLKINDKTISAFQNCLFYANDNFPEAHYGLALYYLSKKDLIKFIHHAQQFLQTNTTLDPWQILSSIIQVLAVSNEQELYTNIKMWCLEMIKTHPHHIPKDVHAWFTETYN